MEGARTHREELCALERCAREHGERAVGLRTGLGGQAIRDLELHHEDDALDVVGVVHRAFEEPPGDLVREVAAQHAR
jgi:hypothetical protein